MEVRVLGSVGVHRDGEDVELGPQLRRVLAALVVRHDSVVSMDRLIDTVWMGEPPDGADGSLRTYVTRLRRAIDPDREGLITFQAPGYVLSLNGHDLDSERFEADLDEAIRLLRTADDEAAMNLLTASLGRWRGDAYAGFADEDWARPEAVRLQERRVEAAELLIEARLGAGDVEQAVADAQALAEAEPLRERPRALLLRALYAAGRQAEALREYREFRTLLVEEAGLDPSAELVELEGRIARSDPSLSGSVRTLRGYELGERIGEGAFAVVHRAVQPGIEREVAVKIIRSELADRPEFVRRFEHEAQVVAAVEHPHVVPLYDYWREPGAAYLVMRLLRGGSVEDVLRTRGPFDRRATAELLRDVGGALEAAHRKGVVHRDVRPANLLLDEDGSAYLADFGIALPTATADDVVVASPAYASPELLRGEPTGVAADVLSLGVTTFELLTGRLPFADSDSRAQLIRRQLTEPLPSARATRPDLPPEIDEILARATAKAPGDRHATVAALVDELVGALGEGVAVAPSTDELRRRSRAAAANPYVGLHAFDERDADRFHGREALVTEIVEALERQPFVVVVGPSGSGKSSVVRAGLVPALRHGAIAGSAEWFITGMLPGADPIDALETALLRIAVNPPASLREQLDEPGGLLRAVRRVLPDDDTTLLVVIDQFEELFTMTATDEQTRFLDELVAAITTPGSPLRVAATLRADHYDVPLRHPGFAELVDRGTITVRPMSPDELERAIVAPAASVGVEVEPALIAELVAGVNERPAALPLLQFALTEGYERRVSDLMLASTHHDLGGLIGAVAARADRIVEAGGPDDEAETRRIFGRLVTLGEGVEDTRRRALRSELGDGERTAWLLDAFVNARLLTVDHHETTREPTVEIAHEALLRDWPRLRDWLADDRDDLRVLRAVGNATADWDSAGNDPGELARGGRLETATELAARRPDLLSEREAAWVAASVAAAEASSRREARRLRNLRRLAAAMAVVLIVALVAGAVAVVQQRRADDEARLAASAAEEAELATLISRSAATVVEEPDVSVLLALEAHRRSPRPETEQALVTALSSGEIVNRVDRVDRLFDASDPCESYFPPGGSEPVRFGLVSADGKYEFRTIGEEMLSKNLVTGEVVNHGLPPTPCAIWLGDLANDRRVVTSQDNDRFWFGAMAGPLTELELDVDTPAFLESRSLESDHALFWQPRDGVGRLSVVDLTTSETVATVDNPVGGGPPFDRLVPVVTGGADDAGGNRLVVVDMQTGDLVFDEPIPFNAINAVVDPATNAVVLVTDAARLVFVDLTTGEVTSDVPTEVTAGVLALDVASDGEVTVVTEGEAIFVDRWTGPTGRIAQLGDAASVRVRPDGTVAVLDFDNRITVYDLSASSLAAQTWSVDPVLEVAFGAESAVIHDRASGRIEAVGLAGDERKPIELIGADGGPIEATSVFPDGDGYLALSADMVLTRWRGGEIVEEADLGSEPGVVPAGRVSFLMSGAVIGERSDGTTEASLLDLEEGQLGVSMTVTTGGRNAISAHPAPNGGLYVVDVDGVLRTYDSDGQVVAEIETGGEDPEVLVWDENTGDVAIGGIFGFTVVDPMSGAITGKVVDIGPVASLTFVRDGQFLIVVGDNGDVALWDVERNQSAGQIWDGSGVSAGTPSWYDESSETIWIATSGKLVLIPLDPRAWVERACEVVDRDLTAEEWERLVPGDLPPQSPCSG